MKPGSLPKDTSLISKASTRLNAAPMHFKTPPCLGICCGEVQVAVVNEIKSDVALGCTQPEAPPVYENGAPSSEPILEVLWPHRLSESNIALVHHVYQALQYTSSRHR